MAILCQGIFEILVKCPPILPLFLQNNSNILKMTKFCHIRLYIFGIGDLPPVLSNLIYLYKAIVVVILAQNILFVGKFDFLEWPTTPRLRGAPNSSK